MWLLTGKGGGSFAPAILAVSIQGASNIAAADFNEDKKLDLAVTLPLGGTAQSGAGFAVVLGNGNGTFQSPQIFTTPTRPLAVAVGSLIKGGPPSIVVNATDSSYV